MKYAVLLSACLAAPANAFDGTPCKFELAQFGQPGFPPLYDPRVDPRRYYPRGGEWDYGPREGFRGPGPRVPWDLGPRPWPYAPRDGSYVWPRPYSPYYLPRRLGGPPYFGGYPPYEWYR